MKAILYIRVSTNKQEHSPEVQRKKLEAYCTLKDYDISRVIVDTKSGKNTARPGLQEALELLKDGKANVLIVAKLDRLTRSIKDLCDLLSLCDDQGWTFASIAEEFNTGTAMGRFVLNIFAAIAQWERETISERTKEVVQELKSNGKRWCKDAPYGFQWVDGELAERPDEAIVMQMILTEYIGGRGQSKVAEFLNSAGIRTRLGTAWTKQMVSKRLKQHREVGDGKAQ